MNFKNINLLGLNTYASHRVTEQNYLLDCNNIVADQLGVIGTRRGQSFFGQAFTAIGKIFSGINKLFMQADNSMYYYTGTTFSDVGFNSDTYQPYTNTKTNFDSQNKSLFFNGIRVSTAETGTPNDWKIKKIATPGSGVVNAGLEPPINVTITIDTNGTQFQPNDQVRIRVFYQYLDDNNYLITSPVSESVVGINDTANPCGFNVKFQIPPQYNNEGVDVYYAISNTVNNITPDDNLFWSEQTKVSQNANISNGLTSVYSFNNIVPKDLLFNPVDLYTNASQEGILQNNDPPVASGDIETYAGHTFYANLTDRNQLNAIINYFPLNAEVMVLNGVTYKRATTSDYAKSPVEFSGSTTLEYAYDFARAITATQSGARARVVSGDFSNMGDVVGWQNKAPDPIATTQFASATADNNNNIYVLPQSTTNREFYVYNTIADSWTRLPDLPGVVNGGGLAFISSISGQFVYCLMGIDSSNAQCPVYKYNISNSTWTTLGFPPAIGGINAILNAATVTDGSNIYCIMGQNFGGTAQPFVYRFNSATDTWDPAGTVANVPTPAGAGRIKPGAVYYARTTSPIARRIYVFGGSASGTPVADSYYYNTQNNTWTTITSMPTAKEGVGATVVGQTIFLLNGNIAGPTATNTISEYSIDNDTYSVFTPVTNSTSGFTYGITINGTIYRVSSDRIESYRIGGVNIVIEDRFIGTNPLTWSPLTYISRYPLPGTTRFQFQSVLPATINFSKQGQPEAVPFFNSLNVGSASSPIIRIAALRSSLIILKTDGLYQLNGISPETFGLQQLDPTCQIIAAQSLAKLDNEIYCLTSEGVVAINESGARVISYNIKDLIDEQLFSVPEVDWNTKIVGTAYDLDFKYILTIGSKTFTYNYITDQWTIWHSGNSGIQSWAVHDNRLYYATLTRVLQERKTFTNADFQDENGDGLNAFIEFNNLEMSPGKVIGIQAMQILQRKISNLTVQISAKNNFNTATPFTKLLNQFVSRVMIPNANRTAFYFRPNISWNTEIVATPGTFADSSFEGLDFEFEITDSNIK